jgi:hypothetical protein
VAEEAGWEEKGWPTGSIGSTLDPFMSELDRIENLVGQAARRRRWLRGWEGLWRGVVLGGTVWLVGLGVYKLLPVPWAVVLAAGAVGLLAMVLGFATGGWRRERLIDAALWLDRRERLKERLSSALVAGRDPRAGEWGRLVIEDAARHTEGVDIRRMLPVRLPKASRWALLVLALTAGLGFVPEYRTKAYRQRQREREAVREAGRNLAELAKRTLERRTPALEPTRQAVRSVGELGNEFARNPVTRDTAMRDLARMTEKVREEARELGRNPALRAIEKAARSSDRGTQASAEAMQKQLEEMQKGLGTKEPDKDSLEKLQKDLDQAQQAARNLMGQGAQAGESARANLAQALSNLARQAEQLGLAVPSLQEAAAALQAGQIDQVLKDLQVAEKDIEKLREMAEALQQMQAQAEKIGKDLAEQLKNGQAEAAIGTLLKMANELKSGPMTPERLGSLMKELSKALDPAGPYGKVPDLLKQALRQLEGNQKPAAAQSLADAAQELQRLLNELADAQDLKATLDALKRAQLCVGNCQGWGAMPGMPGSKPGGRPGRGVGTWADEDGWDEPPENTGLWDNSDIERPDRDPRGITDRGDGELPPGMTPTKVKGRFQPGSQMPSIPLRGVSIKGQSTVGFREAAAAAQSEAQSALSHEQVPRAYQGAVKGYFDDLGKQ